VRGKSFHTVAFGQFLRGNGVVLGRVELDRNLGLKTLGFGLVFDHFVCDGCSIEMSRGEKVGVWRGFGTELLTVGLLIDRCDFQVWTLTTCPF
jgi:hypothetical protein